jgi:DNA helicase-2/ATP-dependent DNA helicase PcrA
VHPRAALSKISLFKSRGVDPAEALKAAEDDWEDLVAKSYRAYEGHLKRSRTVDFDDLLLMAVRLVRDHADVRAKLQDRFRWLLVDEYQDTNAPQYELLRLLAGERRNLCVVGDDDQSIYGWRGADVRKILGFERDFPGAKVVRLETNYRSTEEILDAANLVIRNNPARHGKVLKAASGKGEAVRVFETDDEEAEAAFVTDEIAREARAGRLRFGDVAVLFRTAQQPRVFEARLRTARIPYDLVGGMSFFDRKEVRDLLAYLRLAANPDDEASLLRVVNVPPRGVGKATVDRVVEAATAEGISAGAAFEKAEGEAAESVRRFRALLSQVGPRAKEAGLATAIRDLVSALNYGAELDRCYPDPTVRQARWAAVEEFVAIAEAQRRRGGETLQEFLEAVTLSQEDSDEEPGEERDRVTLMTLHAAKGLEFPWVYLVGVEEGLLPHSRSLAEGTLEEERRLMYVGITRARRRLTLTRALTRSKYGRREGCLPSRFIFEMRGQPVPYGPAPTAGKPAGRPAGKPAARKAPAKAKRKR